jgi:hypothetical protein
VQLLARLQRTVLPAQALTDSLVMTMMTMMTMMMTMMTMMTMMATR